MTEQKATPTTVGALPKWQMARDFCQNGMIFARSKSRAKKNIFSSHFFLLTTR